MTSVRHHVEFSLRPDLVQLPCSGCRADHIVPALHNRRWDVPYLVDVLLLEQLALLHPAFVDEVVILDSCKGQRPVVLFALGEIVLINVELGR